MLYDNIGAIYLTENAESRRTKHIRLRFHYVREKCQAGEIKPRYVPTTAQLADIFTKALTEQKFKDISQQIREFQP